MSLRAEHSSQRQPYTRGLHSHPRDNHAYTWAVRTDHGQFREVRAHVARGCADGEQLSVVRPVECAQLIGVVFELDHAVHLCQRTHVSTHTSRHIRVSTHAYLNALYAHASSHKADLATHSIQHKPLPITQKLQICRIRREVRGPTHARSRCNDNTGLTAHGKLQFPTSLGSVRSAISTMSSPHVALLLIVNDAVASISFPLWLRAWWSSCPMWSGCVVAMTRIPLENPISSFPSANHLLKRVSHVTDVSKEASTTTVRKITCKQDHENG